MKLATAFLVVTGALAGLQATARAADDVPFVTKAAEGGLAEMQMAQLAQSKAQHQAVKDLATRLFNDHSKADDELKVIAGKDHMTLPAAMNIKQQREYNKLQALSGAAFDREYVNAQIKDHKQDIDLFQHEAERGANADVKAWAAKNLPVLREHLQMAENAQNALK